MRKEPVRAKRGDDDELDHVYEVVGKPRIRVHRLGSRERLRGRSLRRPKQVLFRVEGLGFRPGFKGELPEEPVAHICGSSSHISYHVGVK